MRAALTALAAAAAAAALSAAAAQAQPIVSAIVDPSAQAQPASFAKMAAAGAQVVRLELAWSSIAPTERPASFDAEDPADPAYRWAAADGPIQAAVAAGLTPLVDITAAPAWANKAYRYGPGLPDATELARFARAAAIRYGGAFEGLPRIRYWQVWNEPNISLFLTPQLAGGKPVTPAVYRAMVNGVAKSVKAVHADNLVVAGGLAPFFDNTPDVQAQNPDWGPLTFMRELLCLSKTLQPTCRARTRFDVWSTHPYTSGGPTHTAVKPDDVSLGDIPEMRAVLDAAVRVHHVVSAKRPRFWVTEFSWDSSPPDPRGVPAGLLKRWVPQALYELWRNGVSLVTWFLLRDERPSKGYYQSGLYFADGRPQPDLQGFRFPLVAVPRGNGVYVWGRTPKGVRGSVVVERRAPEGRWRRLGVVSVGRDGLFQKTFGVRPTGLVRGRLVGASTVTLPFSLRAVPDRFFNPFGATGLLEPKKQ